MTANARGDHPAYRPSSDEAADALSRVNRIVWTSWVVATLVLVGALVSGHWGTSITGMGLFVLIFVQDDAIKAARRLGHGRRPGAK